MAQEEDVVRKFNNGELVLLKANDDEQLCGFALMVFHGALEEFFRLAPEVSEYENNVLNGSRSGWVDLTNIWQEHYDLSAADKRYILDANDIRQDISHGKYVAVDRSKVVVYERFVKDFIQQNSTISITSISDEQTAVSTDPPRSAPKPASKKGSSCIKRLVIGILIIGLLYFGFRWVRTNLVENPEMPTLNEEEFMTPASSPSNTIRNEEKIKIQVDGDSYVRSGPGVDFDKIGVALDKDEYEVLETTPDKTWLKIEFDSDKEGWIGSSRVIQISP